jgi:hypothetical protein
MPVIRLYDGAGNETVLGESQIKELGLPHAVVVAATPSSPEVASITPGFGPEAGGTVVEISGTEFTGANAVVFGAIEATEFVVNSPTSITAVAPAGTGLVDVLVTTPGGTSKVVAADQFQYSPPISFTSQPNPSQPSSKVTFTASVDPVAPAAPAPTGSVTFRDDETVLGVVPVNAEGTATLKVSSLSAGEHSVVAEYSGDSRFGPSEAQLIQIVSRLATEVDLTSSKNPARAGSSGSLTATVGAAFQAGGKPTGTITFSEGSTILGTVPLSGKSAKLSLKTLGPGVHKIVAAYSGDADFEPSTSPVLVQTITP